MSAMSDYLEREIANLVLGNVAWSKPGSVYLDLYKGAPSDSGGGTTISTSGTGYSRLTVTNDAANWPNAHATTGVKANGAAFTFPTAITNWGTITHFAIWDAPTSGNMLYWGVLSTPRVINAGDTARFAIGDIEITLSSGSDYFDSTLGDYILGGGAYTPSATVYVGLHTADPTHAGTVGELSGSAYARAIVANNTTNWPNVSASTGLKQNGTAIIFPTASGSWGTITHWSIWSASTSGNLLFQGALGDPRTIGSGDTPRFLANALRITFA